MQETLLIIHRCIERLDFPRAAEVLQSSLVRGESDRLTSLELRGCNIYVFLGRSLLVVGGL